MKEKNHRNKKTRKIIYTIICLAIISTAGLIFFLLNVLGIGKKPVTSEGWENRYFTLEELKKYDGSKPNKPIYMGYEGKVYDVTSGAAFYSSGKTYNYLTGRDSTTELNEVGVGGIIVRKYPVIGKIKY